MLQKLLRPKASLGSGEQVLTVTIFIGELLSGVMELDERFEVTSWEMDAGFSWEVVQLGLESVSLAGVMLILCLGDMPGDGTTAAVVVYDVAFSPEGPLISNVAVFRV